MATLASDNFNRTDSSSIGGDWTEASGDWEIATNKLKKSANDLTFEQVTWDTALGASPAADYTVSADVVVNNAVFGEIYVEGRRADASNYYLAGLNKLGGGMELGKVIAGSFTSLGTYAFTVGNGTTYNVKLEMIGTALKAYLDGVERISATDSDLSATGKPALETDLVANTYDNFLVEGTPAATTSTSTTTSSSTSTSTSTTSTSSSTSTTTSTSSSTSTTSTSSSTSTTTSTSSSTSTTLTSSSTSTTTSTSSSTSTTSTSSSTSMSTSTSTSTSTTSTSSSTSTSTSTSTSSSTSTSTTVSTTTSTSTTSTSSSTSTTTSSSTSTTSTSSSTSTSTSTTITWPYPFTIDDQRPSTFEIDRKNE